MIKRETKRGKFEMKTETWKWDESLTRNWEWKENLNTWKVIKKRILARTTGKCKETIFKRIRREKVGVRKAFNVRIKIKVKTGQIFKMLTKSRPY